MTVPDFKLTKTEFDYLYWLVCESNPEFAKIEPWRVTFSFPDTPPKPDQQKVSVVVSVLRQNGEVGKSTVEYNRRNIQEFSVGINIGAQNIMFYRGLEQEAERSFLHRCRGAALDIPLSYIKLNNKSSQDGDTHTHTADYSFNSLCLYGTASVKAVKTLSSVKTLAACLPVKVLDVFSYRDLGYVGSQYGDFTGVSSVKNEQLKILYGFIARKNPEYIRFQPEYATYDYGTADFQKESVVVTVTDRNTNTSVTISLKRLNINHIKPRLQGDIADYLQIPAYLWSEGGIRANIIDKLTNHAIKLGLTPPDPDGVLVPVQPPGGITPADHLKNNTKANVSPRLNDICYYWYASEEFTKVNRTVLSTVPNKVLSGLYLADVSHP